MALARKAAWERGAYDTEEYRKSISLGNSGKKRTDETRALLSKSARTRWDRQLAEGYVVSDEHRANNAAAQTGKKQSEETKIKRSLALKAAWAKRLADGYVFSDEHKANISKAKLAASAAKQETL